MANYYCTARSNYFRVKDAAPFKVWAEHIGIDVYENPLKPGNFAAFPSKYSDSGAFPGIDPETDEEIDFADELSKHLAPGNVAVLLEAGAEKLRYLHGHAIAIDSTGAFEQISLDDIYERARVRFPEHEITSATY